MPHIQIIGWPIKNDETAQNLLAGITRVMHETVGCPLDKITVSIQEINPSRWSDAGVVGNHPDFLIKSRQLQYAERKDKLSD